MGRVREETVRGLKWGVLQKFTMQPIQFIYGIILARLITPEDFGILGLTGVFFAIAGQIQNCGFGAALIRKQDRTEADCSTVFWYNVLASAFLSSVLFLSAPLLADFYNQPALLNITRVSSLLMFLGSTGSVHWSLYSARRDFKTPAIVGMVNTLIAMPFTIWAAFAGWGYWALMLQGIISGLLGLIIVWVISPWRPRLLWSNQSFKEFFLFGYKMVLRGFSFTIFNNIRTLTIGKFYQPSALGEFERANHIAYLPNTWINGLLGSVTYPILASIQHDRSRLNLVYRKYIRITCMCIFMGSTLLIALCEPIISLLYGPQWKNCVPYIQILTWAVMTYHIVELNNNLLLVNGRSDVPLKVDLCKQFIHLTFMIPALFISVKAVCYVALITAPINLCLTLYCSSRVTGLGIRNQFSDFMPYFLLATLCALPAYLFSICPFHDIIKILLGLSASISLYFFVLYIKRDTSLREILDCIQKSRFCPKRFRGLHIGESEWDETKDSSC